MIRYITLFFLIIFFGSFNTAFADFVQDIINDVPAVPKNARAEVLSSDQIMVSWEYEEAEEKINHFLIERADESTLNAFEEILRTNKHSRSIIDENLKAKTTYKYRIIASNPDGLSTPSDIAEATTLSLAPNPPTDLTANGITASSIRLTWEHDMFNSEKIVIERSNLFLGPFNEVGETSIENTTYEDDGLAPIIPYYYRVKAVSETNEDSEYSNVASSTTALLATAPTAPSDLAASGISSSSVTLTWVDNSDNEDNFIVERATVEAGPFTVFSTLGPNITTTVDADVSPATTYYYRVKAKNAVDNSGYTQTIQVTTLDIAPVAPSGLTASPTSATSISLQWTDNSSNEDNFILERSTAEAGPFTAIELAANLETYSDGSLSFKTTYYYRIKAVNTAGSSAYTEVANAKTSDVKPAAPSGLQVTTKTASTVTLTWTDNSGNETYFSLERSISASTGFVEIVKPAANSTTYVDEGLASNTTYYYRIRAHNDFGDSEYSVAIDVKTNDVAPSAPTALQVMSKTSNAVTLNWTDNSNNETAFILERSATSATSGFSALPQLASNTQTYVDEGLTSNTTYYYRIKAHNDIGDSEYSETISVKTNDVAPSAPTALQVTSKTANTVTLKWTDNSNNEAGFILERSATSATSGFSALPQLPANTQTYKDEGLTSNTTYYYRVKAINAIDESAYSAVSVTTDKDIPLTPSGLVVTDFTTTSLTLSWNDNSTNETGFVLERSLEPAEDGFTMVAQLPENTESYIDEGLTSNQTYFYRIRAFNADGPSANSVTVSGTTLREAGPPAAPSLLKATAITTFQINLTWKDNSDNETSFIVKRSKSPTGPFSEVQLPANTSFYENTGLESGTTYYYQVTSTNIDGIGESDIVSATTKSTPQPPAAPTALSAVATSTVQINLSWTDNSNSETYFIIQRAPSSGGPFELVATVGANVTSYQNFGLTANTTYYYRVRAESGDGPSAFTNIDNAKTFEAPKPPAAPTSLTAIGVSTTQINLEWIDNANSETGFVIERASTSDGTYTFVGSVGANITVYQNTGLLTDTEYFYKVRAINNDGTSGYSNAASATTLKVGQAPIPPTNLVANGVSTTQINLTWEDNSVSETNFEIHRASAEEGPYTFLVNVAANLEAYENTGLQPNTIYYYKIRANNADGKSSFSNSAVGTTSEQAQPPAAPDGLTALAVSTTQITLKWNDKAFNETVYEIERRTAGENLFTLVGTVEANDTVFQNFGLAPKTEYTYRVRAQNGDGVSTYSNEAVAVTFESKVPPLAPSDLFGKLVSQNEIELYWTDNAINEEEYIVERAELESASQPTATFTIVDILSSNTTTFLDSEVEANKLYKYRIQAKNSDGESFSNEIIMITSISGNPILATIRPPKYPTFFSSSNKEEGDTLISIEVVQPETYNSVSFFYRGITENDFKEKEVSIDGAVWSVSISGADLDAMGVEYYFEATDAAGIVYVSPKGFTHWLMESPGLTLDLKSGTTVQDYQMFAIPLNLERNNIVQGLEDDLGPYDPSSWRLFTYQEGTMLEKGDFTSIEPGKGYWLITKEENGINTGKGNVLQATQVDPFVLNLQQGWNQIGNPYLVDLSWTDVLAANGLFSNPEIFGPLYTYSGEYVESDLLKSFQGAYLHSEKDTSIVIPVSYAEAANGGRTSYSAGKSNKVSSTMSPDNNWQVNLTLSSGNLNYSLGGVGMHAHAKNTKDNFDRISLPRLSEFLELNFDHSEHFSSKFTRDIVPTQNSYVWDMNINSSLGSSLVTVSWQKSLPVAEGMNLILFDTEKQKPIDMKMQNSYKVAGEDVKFQVYYGDDSFIEKHLKPYSINIGEVFPNPFSEEFLIPVSLPASESQYTINVKIYNSIGNQVGNSYEFTLNEGFHELKLAHVTLKNLSRGLYFYKVRVIQKDQSLIETSGRVLKK